MKPPTITVAYDFEKDSFQLFATSYFSTTPAGPRLFHKPPFPDIKFSHENQESAERDAKILREYIANEWAKEPSKRELRQHNA